MAGGPDGRVLEAPRLRGLEAWLIRELPVRVAGGGRRNREFRSRQFGLRGLAPGFRRLKAERLMPVAVTRHLE